MMIMETGVKEAAEARAKEATEKSQATRVLWLGILSIWPLFFLGPFAWVMGKRELAAIDQGRRPVERRSRAVIGRRLGIGATLFWIAVFGFAAITGTGPFSNLLLEEDFSSDTTQFSLDSDRSVDLVVVDDEYRVRIKDASSPQMVRHLFSRTYDGLRFEATMTQLNGPRDGMLSSIGCWASNHAYLFFVLSTGEVGLLETVSEMTGERLPLTDLIETDALRPVGEPNEVRIDCVGGGVDPSTVTGWLNGQPVVSVTVPVGYDSFNAVGFWLVTAEAPAEFAIDNVVAAAERPDPGIDPMPPFDPSASD